MKIEVLKNLLDLEDDEEIRIHSFQKNLLMNRYHFDIEVIRKEERE